MKRTAIVAAVFVFAVLSACGSDDTASDADEIDQRAQTVMPFDLELTSHQFTKSDTGGRQVVTALDPTDVEQVSLVRSHLAEEADRFRRGDYSGPAEIHGMDMPGLSDLQDGFERIDVTYRNVEGGAELGFDTDDENLVGAVHAWFDRQSMDHA